MAVNPLYDDYVRAKRHYHQAGKMAKGTPEGSRERAMYEEAKLIYREAGRRLAASRVKV